MLYYASLADNSTGAFIGGVYINAIGPDEAAESAMALVSQTCVEAVVMEVPGSNAPIPAIGKLLTREELSAHFAEHGGIEVMESDGDSYRSVENPDFTIPMTKR